MRKVEAFFAALLISIFIYVVFYWMQDKPQDVKTVNEVAFLIFWYMLWKLFHDKKK